MRIALINLGDSLSGPLYPRETAQMRTQLAGNHERLARERGMDDWARALQTGYMNV